MEFIDLTPMRKAAGTVRLPGSKSISNRVLLLAALADGDTLVEALLESDDTRVMKNAIVALGVKVTEEGDALRISGCGGRFPQLVADIFVGNSGLSIRTLVPGHAANHLCLMLLEDGLLLSGDHILNGSTTVVDPPDGNMNDFAQIIVLNAKRHNVTYQEKDELIVSISDTGIGIAPEDYGAVFEQFKQVGGDTLTDKPKGTGLGLPICKEIVEHHGGRIWVESEVG